jgi:hypothetical protein
MLGRRVLSWNYEGFWSRVRGHSLSICANFYFDWSRGFQTQTPDNLTSHCKLQTPSERCLLLPCWSMVIGRSSDVLSYHHKAGESENLMLVPTNPASYLSVSICICPFYADDGCF